MGVGVIDAGIAIGWIQRGHRSEAKLDLLYRSCREGTLTLHVSTVTLAEILIHTDEVARRSGIDPVSFLKASGVRISEPDEAVARRVARLPTALADGFAAATALELGARLHTTDATLVRQLKAVRLAVSHY